MIVPVWPMATPVTSPPSVKVLVPVCTVPPLTAKEPMTWLVEVPKPLAEAAGVRSSVERLVTYTLLPVPSWRKLLPTLT